MTRFAIAFVVLAVMTAGAFAGLAGRQISLRLDCDRSNYADLAALEENSPWKFSRLSKGLIDNIVVGDCGLGASTVGNIKADDTIADEVVVTFVTKANAKLFEACVAAGGHFHADRCDVVAVESEDFGKCAATDIVVDANVVSLRLDFRVLDGGLDLAELNTASKLEMFLWKFGRKVSDTCNIALCDMGFYNDGAEDKYTVVDENSIDVFLADETTKTALAACLDSNVFKADRKKLQTVDCSPIESDPVKQATALGGAGYEGGALVGDKVYMCSTSGATSIEVVDLDDFSVATIDVVNLVDFRENVLADNGLVYFVPFNGDKIVAVEPTDNSFFEITLDFGSATPSENWAGAVNGDDGFVYGIPYSFDFLLIIDTNTNTADITSVSVGAALGSWWGGVKADDGRIFGIPYDANTVMIYDPSTGVADVTSMAVTAANSKWRGGVLGANGKIYAAPYTQSTLLIIDPVLNTVEEFVDAELGLYYVGAALDSFGFVYLFPSAPNEVLRFDSNENTVDVVEVGDPTSPATFSDFGYGVVYGEAVYGLPYYGANSDVLKIETIC
eukprot:m.188288 g.188288  ORF g.188288 m.188288 type:complete len:559 (-) comp13628_c1_seq3:247-1923(-)